MKKVRVQGEDENLYAETDSW